MGSFLVLAHYNITSDIVRTKTHAFSLAWVFFCLCLWLGFLLNRIIVRFGAWCVRRPLPGANHCSVSEAVHPGKRWDFVLVDPLAVCFSELLFGLSDCRTRIRTVGVGVPGCCCFSFLVDQLLWSEQHNIRLIYSFKLISYIGIQCLRCSLKNARIDSQQTF